VTSTRHGQVEQKRGGNLRRPLPGAVQHTHSIYKWKPQDSWKKCLGICTMLDKCIWIVRWNCFIGD